MDLSNVESIHQLFSLWREAHEQEDNYELTTYISDEPKKSIEKESFVADGYICEERYSSSKIKILFVLKEANIASYKNNEGDIPSDRPQYGFYLKYINSDDGLNRPKQQEKMGRMAFYLQHPDYSEERRRSPTSNEIKNALSSSSFMNLNKRGGANKVTAVYYEYIRKYTPFIVKEIELLNPSIIVEIGKTGISAIPTCCNKIISHWHTAYSMSRISRSQNPQYGDKNVDLYMRNFFEKLT